MRSSLGEELFNGKTDEFEHQYMEKFRSLAALFGHFIAHERDIAN